MEQIILHLIPFKLMFKKSVIEVDLIRPDCLICHKEPFLYHSHILRIISLGDMIGTDNLPNSIRQ